MRTLLLSVAFVASLSWPFAVAVGQNLTFGVVAGTNLTDDVQTGRRTFLDGTMPSGEVQANTLIVDPGARRPIIGLKVEYRLRRDWAMELNVIHRELKSTSTHVVSPAFVYPDGSSRSTFGPFTRTLTPWEFPVLAKYRIPMRGPQPFFGAGSSFRPAGTGTGLSHAGFTVEGGAEFVFHAVRVAPTLRYTRWLSAHIPELGYPLLNQLEFLVSMDRPSTSSGVRVFGTRLSVGAIAGIGMGKDFRGKLSDVPEANSGLIGVAIQAPLLEDWAIEADGIYRPLHGSRLEGGRRVRFAHLTWEFPVLLKYRFPGKSGLKPIVVTGPSFRAEGNLNVRLTSRYGATVGAGLETKLFRLRLSPMIRYTRWAGQAGGYYSESWLNQTQLLLSFVY